MYFGEAPAILILGAAVIGGGALCILGEGLDGLERSGRATSTPVFLGDYTMNIEVILDIVLQMLNVLEAIGRIFGLNLNFFGG